MPHIFHMVFAENTDSRDLRTATWGLPLYLLLLSLPILPVTWAGINWGTLCHRLAVAWPWDWQPAHGHQRGRLSWRVVRRQCGHHCHHPGPGQHA